MYVVYIYASGAGLYALWECSVTTLPSAFRDFIPQP